MKIIRLKEVLKESNMTYDELGLKIGVSKTSIARIANHDQKPKLDTLVAIARTLDIDIRDLFHPTKEIGSDKEALKQIREIVNRVEE